MPKSYVLLSLGLLIAGLVLTTSSAEEKEKKGKDAPVVELSKEAREAQDNVEWMVTALKLKERGWGQETRRGWEKVSIESLIDAARILRDLPPVGKLEGKDVEIKAGKEEGATESVPGAEEFDQAKEVDKILARARELVLRTVNDPKQAAAYQTLIAAVGNLPVTKRAVAGGPKMVKRPIQPGQWHTYRWKWHLHLPGMVGFQSNVPMRLTIVHNENENPYCVGVTMGAAPHFLPGGYGKPNPNKWAHVTVRVANPARVAGHYVLIAQ